MKSLRRWSRLLSAEYARFISAVTICMAAVAAITMLAERGSTNPRLETHYGADFAAFYSAATVQNVFGKGELYNSALQDSIVHDVIPSMAVGEHLPFAYPPFVLLPFRVLAMLPYSVATTLWLLISLGLYAGAVSALIKSQTTFTQEERFTTIALAVAFPAFAFENWLGGQVSSLGVAIVCIGLSYLLKGRGFSAGLAFSMLAYKPTLLVLVAPAIVLLFRWRAVAGLFLGMSILGIISLLAAGPGGVQAFVDRLLAYGNTGGSSAAAFRTFKFIDLTAFFSLLPINLTSPRLLALLCAFPVLFLVAHCGLKYRSEGDVHVTLLWSAIFVLTPVLNIYGPVYDAVFAVPGMILVEQVVSRHLPKRSSAVRASIAVVFAASFLTPLFAGRAGLQILTPALFWMGVLPLLILYRDEIKASGVQPA